MGISRLTVVGFIGAGRLGASLAVAMSRRGYRVGAVHRRSAAAAEAVADRISGATATTDAQQIAGEWITASTALQSSASATDSIAASPVVMNTMPPSPAICWASLVAVAPDIRSATVPAAAAERRWTAPTR